MGRSLARVFRAVAFFTMAASIPQFAGLTDYLVKELPKTVYYVPEFITNDDEEYLLSHVNNAPKPKWTQLSHRRLQNWGGLPHPKGMVPEIIPNWLQTYMDRVTQLGVFKDKKPNHVLVNEYQAGQGIMPHVDGSLFTPVISTINLGSHGVLDFYKDLETNDVEQIFVREVNKDFSPGANGTTEIKYEVSTLNDRYTFSLLLMPRSLLIIQEAMYHNYLHGIKEIVEDEITTSIINHESCSVKVGTTLKRGTRVSLTIRHVPKTLKITFGRRGY